MEDQDAHAEELLIVHPTSEQYKDKPGFVLLVGTTGLVLYYLQTIKCEGGTMAPTVSFPTLGQALMHLGQEIEKQEPTPYMIA